MNAVSRRTLLVLIVSAAALAAASTAMAQARPVLLPNPYPTPGPSPATPQLGINYTVIPGYGYRVNYVNWGGPAAQAGVEPGDVILAINGTRLTYNGAHVQALSNTGMNSGWVSLRIRDVRTGWAVDRMVNLIGLKFFDGF